MLKCVWYVCVCGVCVRATVSDCEWAQYLFLKNVVLLLMVDTAKHLSPSKQNMQRKITCKRFRQICHIIKRQLFHLITHMCMILLKLNGNGQIIEKRKVNVLQLMSLNFGMVLVLNSTCILAYKLTSA